MCFTTEERDHHTYFGALHIDLGNHAAEVVERSIDDADALPDLEGDLDRWGFSFHAFDDLRYFLRSQGCGIISHPHEASDAWRIAHHIPGLFRQHHIDQHIAREDV